MVDKDYWLTRVLRRLSAEMPREFLFKGGTSLSMGYSLIDRFSEDIDLLVTSDSADAAIADIVALAEEELGESPETVSESEARKFLIFSFPATARAPERLKNHRSIRVDLGAQGGDHPNEMREIVPIARGLVEARGLATEDEDLQSFSVQVLHPARTCLEKLEAVHSASLELNAGERGPFVSRDGKHPYDVFQILGHQPSIDILSDSGERLKMIEAIDDANRKWFGGPSKRPERGYAHSPAFRDAELSQQLSEATTRAMDSYLWPGADKPTWDDILARVVDSEDLL